MHGGDELRTSLRERNAHCSDIHCSLPDQIQALYETLEPAEALSVRVVVSIGSTRALRVGVKAHLHEFGRSRDLPLLVGHPALRSEVCTVLHGSRGDARQRYAHRLRTRLATEEVITAGVRCARAGHPRPRSNVHVFCTEEG